MRTEIDRQLDRERHDEEQAALKREQDHTDAGEYPCPNPHCEEYVTPDEVAHCANCQRAGCITCLREVADIDGPFCDEDCRSRYYWDMTLAEITMLLGVRGVNTGVWSDGYWLGENPHEVTTPDGPAMQVDYIATDKPTIRVQLLSKKAG